jgi:hypothetical protein
LNRRGIPQPGAKPCSLRWALEYRNDAIIYKFLERWRVPVEEARDLFTENKRWLWLAATLDNQRPKRRGTPRLVIDQPLVMVDEMWHTFVLFTREYSRYCHTRFGYFMHHAPTTRTEKQRLHREFLRAPRKTRRDAEARMRAQYQCVHDYLGEATLLKWYSHYALRYTPAFVRSIERHSDGHEMLPTSALPARH